MRMVSLLSEQATVPAMAHAQIPHRRTERVSAPPAGLRWDAWHPATNERLIDLRMSGAVWWRRKRRASPLPLSRITRRERGREGVAEVSGWVAAYSEDRASLCERPSGTCRRALH